MKDKTFSIRMPRTLLEELKFFSVRNHFMDVSEELRGIIREEWLNFNSPAYQELDTLRKELRQNIANIGGGKSGR